MEKTNIQKTLYIPLYGKAYVSQKGLFLQDTKAEEIWKAEGFALKGRAKSKWLAYYMGIRSAVFDGWTEEVLQTRHDAAVIHLGCGMDSRVLRVHAPRAHWYDVDFPEVIAERKRYYTETDNYTMIAGDVNDAGWLEQIPAVSRAVVVMEGISMYLSPAQLQALFQRLGDRFEQVALLMDSYSTFAAKMSKYKNPVNTVGVTQVYGLDDPKHAECGGFVHERELDITPNTYVDELQGLEKKIFQKLYVGGFAKKLYRLHAYQKA